MSSARVISSVLVVFLGGFLGEATVFAQRTTRAKKPLVVLYAVVDIDGELSVMINWTVSPHIKKGSNQVNRLMVECHGSEIKAFVNDKFLTSVTDNSLQKGFVGIMAVSDQANTRFHFDNLSIMSSSPTTPEPKSTPD